MSACRHGRVVCSASRWTTRPSGSWRKEARSRGCRSSSVCRARRSRSGSTGPVSSNSSWTRYTSVAWSSKRAWKKNPSWSGDTGRAFSSRSTPVAGVVAPASRSAARARAATVRCRKTSRGVIGSPAARARLTSWMATMLSPPSSKKLSWTPTDGRPRTSANRSASRRSTGLVGASAPLRAVQPGAGRARPSSLPLGVSGSGPSRTTTADGTMKSGSMSATWARAAATAASASVPSGSVTR